MAKTETLRARVQPELEREAEAVFRALGLSASEAITLFYRQVTLRRGLPFVVELPNEATRDAMRQAPGGGRFERMGRPRSARGGAWLSAGSGPRGSSRGICGGQKGRGKNLDRLWHRRPPAARWAAPDEVPEPSSVRRVESALERHIEPDWPLVWNRAEDALILVRTGTHADLFGWSQPWQAATP